ncbi:MAG: GNAT family N-acetyltransferase [Oceanospirillaceae bacterium]|nr:GNAT family N-acetyltransferase [Oceanospirillaceae bacterium]|tara:strand:+ start:4562 stop:5158 length:597 start_codon:yes stop_codon:yes gene_type:complete
MVKIIQPETPRLLLRQWQLSDREPLANMSADTEVMKFFPAVMSREESDAMADRLEAMIAENGYGPWAVELKETGEFIGFVGLFSSAPEFPVTPSIQILWRLARPFWGYGYASEAANAALATGFNELGVNEIVACAALGNNASASVMARLGFTDTGVNFHHHFFKETDQNRLHRLYRLHRDQWLGVKATGEAERLSAHI